MNKNRNAAVELLLIRNEPSCKKCHQVEAVLRNVAEAYPDAVSVRVITAEDTEAHRYGVLLVPMVLLNGKGVCAGSVPLYSTLTKLVETELIS